MILVLSDLWAPFPGGAERLIFNLARDLHRRGERVHVLTGYGPAQQFDGPPVEVRPLGTGPTRDQGGAEVAAYLEDVQPDVVLTHHYYASQYHPELAAWADAGWPIVQVVLNGQRMPEATLAVYISQWVRAQDPTARDTDLLVTPPVFDDVVAAEHGDAIGFIKPIEHKGVELLYQVAEALPRRRFLVLRGEWQDIELIRTDLPNVEFMEPQDDIRAFYAQCRLLLVPSRSEDAGTVAQEATANGLACISSDVQGLAETNGGGVLLPPDLLDAWVGAIKALDHAVPYARCVARQQAHLAATDQQGRLDTLYARIKELL